MIKHFVEYNIMQQERVLITYNKQCNFTNYKGKFLLCQKVIKKFQNYVQA